MTIHKKRKIAKSRDTITLQSSDIPTANHRYRRKVLLAFADNLRREATLAERTLWPELIASKLGARFSRQHIRAGWILDFYCHKARLAVEIDGGYHNTPEQQAKDKARDLLLKEKCGIETLRFTNNRIFL